MMIFDLIAKSLLLAASVSVDVPFDGKVTVAIDREDGTRVRNLVCGQACKAGPQAFDWDCKGEDGALVEPGEYRLRVLAHPGLSYDFLGSFGNGGEKLFQPYGPNHMTLRALAARKGEICASAFFTEGGNSTVVLRNDGSLKFGVSEIWGNGNRELIHVSGDGDFFYAVREDKAGDKSLLLLFAYSWERPERPNLVVPRTDTKRAGAFRVAPLAGRTRKTLGGAALLGGRLYVSDALAGGVSVYPLKENATGRSAVLGALDRTIPVDDPGCLARLDATHLLGASGARLFILDTATGAVAWQGELPSAPTALAPDPNESGVVCTLFRNGQTVARHEIGTGRLLGTLGEPGGAYQGPWRKDRLVEPRGLVFGSDGGLWITEERYKPKRISKWDVRRGTCVYEKCGSEMYGSPAAGMDEADPTRWVAHDCLWHVGADGREAPVAVLQPEKPDDNGAWDLPPVTARTYRFVRRGARTFLIGVAGETAFWELKDDRAVPLAFFSAADAYLAHLPGKAVPPALLAAYQRARNRKDAAKAVEAMRRDSAPFLWKDLNGDGRLQAEEFAFLPKDTVAPIGGWGFFPEDLDFSFPVWTGSETRTLFFAAGSFERLPDYDLLRAWERAAVNARPRPKNQRTTQGNAFADRFGRAVVVGSGPNMLGFDRQGQLAWHLRNRWANVHGSHDAPLPRPGELQGVLFALGAVPFSRTAEAMAIVGNHGRVFFVTTDGLYLDELFTDCRVSSRNDETYIGGEAFGGSFQYDRVSQRPILQAGGGGYRRYAIKGLDRAVERAGRVTVTAKDVAHAIEADQSRVVQPKVPKILEVGEKPSSIRWTAAGRAVEVTATAAAAALVLSYQVTDESPWKNTGDDPFLKFKTGDCVTFDFAAQAKNPDRHQAQAGDVRFVAFPHGDGVQVAAYRFKTGGKGAAKSFSSPWRTFAVDDVALAPDVRASVRREPARYTLELTLPYAALGVANPAGRDYRADFGVIFGDAEGTVNLSRTCWSNKATGLVNDVPGEIMPDPARWGTLSFAARGRLLGAKPVVFEPAGVLANPGGLLYGTDDPSVPRHSIGPAWHAKEKLLAVSSGTGRLTALTPSGRRVADWTLPGAKPFTRFNTMAFAPDGALFALAGTDVWRVAPKTADGGTGRKVPLGFEVCGMSTEVTNGALLLHRKSGPVLELDVKSLAVREIGSFPVRADAYNMPLFDRTPSGDVAFIRNHVDLYRLAQGELTGPTRFFGTRELTMQHGTIIGDELWALMGDTLKRYDAKTMAPAPGVVFGGASGAFIGTVEHDWEMDLTGFRRLSPEVCAGASWPRGTVHLFRWDAANGKMTKLRRYGPVKNPAGLFLDRYGAIVTEGLVWPFDAAPDAPTVATHRRGKDWGTVQLPGGRILSVILDSALLRFRQGRPEGRLEDDPEHDLVRGVPETLRKTRTADAVLRTDGARRFFVRIATDGQVAEWELTPAGHPRKNAFRTGRLQVPGPADANDRVVTGASLTSDGRLLAVVRGRLTVFSPGPDGLFGERGRAFAPAPAEDVSCGDGLVVASDPKAGKLTAYAEDGRELGSVTGLAEPSLVSSANGRVVVHERAAQRFLRFNLKEK